MRIILKIPKKLRAEKKMPAQVQKEKTGLTSSATISNRLERLFLLLTLVCRIKYFWA